MLGKAGARVRHRAMSCAPARGYARCDACYTLAVVLLAGIFTDSGSRDLDMGFPEAGVKAPSAWAHSPEVSRALISLAHLEKVEPQVLTPARRSASPP